MRHSFERTLRPNRQEFAEQKKKKTGYLKKIATIEQLLRDPEFSGAIKGFEGLKVTNEILKQRNCKGVLVGGLATAIWDNKNTAEDLEKHKDVDILVLDKNFKLEKDFEAGVDWWLPQEASPKYNGHRTYQNEYWQNGAGTILAFWTSLNYEFKSSASPGLYLPSKDFVRDMKWSEIKTMFDYYRCLINVASFTRNNIEQIKKGVGYHFENDKEEEDELQNLNDKLDWINMEIDEISNKFLKDFRKDDFEEMFYDIRYGNDLESEFKSTVKLNYLSKDIGQYFKGNVDNKKNISAIYFEGEEFYAIKEEFMIKNQRSK